MNTGKILSVTLGGVTHKVAPGATLDVGPGRLMRERRPPPPVPKSWNVEGLNIDLSLESFMVTSRAHWAELFGGTTEDAPGVPANYPFRLTLTDDE